MPEIDNSRQSRRAMAPLFGVGAILVGSGVFHVVIAILDGGTWSGDVSWRKPILFGFSAGATMISLGWVASKVRPRRGDSVLFAAFSFAMLAEVGLITLQQWRGVPSHFNRSTAIDATILMWIEGLILFATVVIADLTWRSFSRLTATRDMTFAIRSGMALLLFACLLGFVLVGYGNHQRSIGRPPGIYGQAGVMKFPHGMPIHAIQFFPVLAWSLYQLGASDVVRFRAVCFAIWSMLWFTIFSLIQTFSGRARFDVGWISALVLSASCVFLTVPVFALVSSVFKRARTDQCVSNKLQADIGK